MNRNTELTPENSKNMISFPAGETYNLSKKYQIHAHPLKRGFPTQISEYLTLRQHGGIISEIYHVVNTIEIFPYDEKNAGEFDIDTNQVKRLYGYLSDRMDSFGFEFKNIPYRFYILELYKKIEPTIKISPNPRSYVYYNLTNFITNNLFLENNATQKLDSLKETISTTNSKNRGWIITVTVTGDDGYDIFKAAEELNNIWWTKSKGNKNIDVGDIIYMYVGRPYSKIMYKFKCTDLNYDGDAEYLDQDIQYWNRPELHLDERGESFCLTKLQYLDDENLSLKKLNEKGVIKGNIRSTFKEDNNPKLFEYIESQFSKARDNSLYFEEDIEYNVDVNNNGETIVVTDAPQKKLSAEIVNGSPRYKRDPRIGRYAIECTGYKCEIDGTHRTFISRGSEKPYLESHHLIPISAQGNFEHSLDVPANIVALCSTCHNEIHYGKDAQKLITNLYNNRKGRLNSAGIDIELEELLNLYKL